MLKQKKKQAREQQNYYNNYNEIGIDILEDSESSSSSSFKSLDLDEDLDRAKTQSMRLSPHQIEMIKRQRQKRRKTNRASNAELARESMRKYNKLGIENVEGFKKDMLVKMSPSALGSRVNSPNGASSSSSKKREKLVTPNSKTSRNSSKNKDNH